MDITRYNILEYYKKGINPIVRSRIIPVTGKYRQYRLLNTLNITLSNNDQITIPEGFEWDLSSVPRIFWPILPPDGDFELAALIHDYIYQTKLYKREFADYEMLFWSLIVNNTNKISLKRIDNYIRYYAVRIFGSFVWNRKKKVCHPVSL